MLKKVWLIIGLMVVSVIALAGCSTATSTANPDEIRAALGQEFTLPVGKTVVINGENLSLKFDSVTTDSRCPTGVQCVWAGEAKCLMKVTKNGSTSDAEFVIGGASDASAGVTFDQYKAQFELLPYPTANQQINHADYKLEMKISKQ